jgi:hypothetical protein
MYLRHALRTPYIFKRIIPKAFEESAIHAFDMELSIVTNGHKAHIQELQQKQRKSRFLKGDKLFF